MDGFGGLLNGGDDARVRAAAADISLQGLHDFRLAGIRIFLEQRDAADNHSRRAVRTLKRAVIEECLLHGMKLAVLFKALDGDDGFPCRVADRKLARAPRRAIQQNGACTALAFTAAIFGASQAKLFTQRREQRSGWIRFEKPAFSIDLRVD